MKNHIAFILLISMLLMSACTTGPMIAYPEINCDGKALKTYDIPKSEESPEELIRGSLNLIPFTETDGSDILFFLGEEPKVEFKITYAGVYTDKGERLEYTQDELKDLPDGKYIICALSERKDKNGTSEKYMFAGIKKGLQKTIVNKPDDTDLVLWLTEDVKEFDFSEFTPIPGWFGAYEYYGIGYSSDSTEYVSYLITAYPDYADGGEFVTSIKITDPSVNIINGLTIESDPDMWDAKLTELGLERQMLTDIPDTIEFRAEWQSPDGKFTVLLTKINGKYEFVMRAKVENRDNIIF